MQVEDLQAEIARLPLEQQRRLAVFLAEKVGQELYEASGNTPAEQEVLQRQRLAASATLENLYNQLDPDQADRKQAS